MTDNRSIGEYVNGQNSSDMPNVLKNSISLDSDSIGDTITLKMQRRNATAMVVSGCEESCLEVVGMM